MVRFQLDSALAFPDWLPLLNHMAAYDIRSPSDMAALSKADFYLVAVTSPDANSLSKLLAGRLSLRSRNSETTLTAHA